MKLTSTDIILRAPEPSDIDMLYLLENASGMNECGFATAPRSRLEISRYIESYNADIYSARELRLIIIDRATGHSVGTIDITDYEPRDRRGFAGIAIVESERGKGMGTKALDLLCSYASEVLGMHQLAAQIACDNEASRRLFDRCGFKPCGMLRSWLRRGRHYADAIIVQRLFPD